MGTPSSSRGTRRLRASFILTTCSLAGPHRLSKQWSDLSFVPGVTEARAREVNLKAIDFANQAIQTDPASSAGYLAACISKGRLALVSDNKQKVRLGREAHQDAVKALQLDPNSDLAHHLMGRWMFEMANINWVVRTLVRIAWGTELPSGSYPEALQNFEAAMKVRCG